MPVTCLTGPATRLLELVEKVKEQSGSEKLRDAWPALTAVVASVQPADPALPRLSAALGPKVSLVETHFRPEGPVAVHDPRAGGLRLLTNHGSFFEFIPTDEANRPCPRRLGLGEVAPGVPHEVVMTSPAGLWACRIGLTVCFEQHDPPLLRLVETIPPRAVAAAVAAAPPIRLRSFRRLSHPIDEAPALRQRLQKASAIALGQHPRIEDDHHAPCRSRVRISRPKPCFSLMTACGTW